MTPKQTVTRWSMQNGCTVDAANRVPTISKNLGDGKWFIECFDSWEDAEEYLRLHTNNFVNRGTIKPWTIPNI